MQSLLPVIVTLIITFWKKNIFLALLSGIATGSVLLSATTGDLFIGFNTLASVFSNPSTTKVILFVLLTGALMHVISKSGGVEGTVLFMTEKTKLIKSKRGAQFLAQSMGLILFVDATSSIIVSSLIGKPFFDKFKIPREKLALIANSTGSPIAWLIPFGGAGALTATAINGIGLLPEDGFSYVLSAVGFQFYSIVLLILIFLSIVFNFEIGVIKSMNSNHEKTKEMTFETQLNQHSQPKARNMAIPLSILLGLIFTLLFITGNGNILKGDGSTSVFVSGCLTLILTGIYYLLQRMMTLEKYIEWCFDGMKQLLEITVILVLAFAFSQILTQLKTAEYLSTVVTFIPHSVIPLMSLVLAAVISFSTGSSGGTVSILIPILIPLAMSLNVNLSLVIGAVISGAVFGDQSSPISDSVILTSSMTDVKIMDHVKTQLPYTVIALFISSILFLILGMIL